MPKTKSSSFCKIFTPALLGWMILASSLSWLGFLFLSPLKESLFCLLNLHQNGMGLSTTIRHASNRLPTRCRRRGGAAMPSKTRRDSRCCHIPRFWIGSSPLLVLEYTIPKNDGGNLALEYERKKAFRCRKKLVYIPPLHFCPSFS